jgi:hypothetical protein
VRAGFHGAIRFVVRDGSYHAAALTYYSILAIFPAGALVYGLLGLVGAESVVDDAVDALERRDVESQFADALRDTLSSAVNQRSDEATIAVAISVGAAVYVASRWVRERRLPPVRGPLARLRHELRRVRNPHRGGDLALAHQRVRAVRRRLRGRVGAKHVGCLRQDTSTG